MKPSFLIRTPSGRRWHVVNEFVDRQGDVPMMATILCDPAGYTSPKSYPLDPHRMERNLTEDDVVCKRCAGRVRRHAEVLARHADTLEAHTTPPSPGGPTP